MDDLEIETCSVARTAVSMTLTVRATDGRTCTLTMSREIGMRLLREMVPLLVEVPFDPNRGRGRGRSGREEAGEADEA